MTLIRWNPATPSRYAMLDAEIDRMFGNFFARPAGADLPAASMPVDIEETPEAYVLRADLPGVAQKDIKVTLTGEVLTLAAERRREAKPREGATHRLERAHGACERSFTLGRPVAGAAVEATYRDGVLEVRVPKAEEARQREIEVRVG